MKLLRPLLTSVAAFMRAETTLPRRRPGGRQLPDWAHRMARKQQGAQRAR